ncbi:MAG: dTMP kinase [Alphaproteobacteria bacterium]
MVTRGRFITLEGGEGAGKSTQIGLLAKRLASDTRTVIQTREPGGSPGAEAIRGLLVDGSTDRWDAKSEALLHFTARREHLLHTVWPALDRGDWVISDRFADSTMAYQGYGHQLGRQPIEQLYRIVVGDFRPDLTIILDLPVQTGLQRATSRGPAENRYEMMPVEFHQRLRDGFLDIAKREPDRCIVIGAAASIEHVADEIWKSAQRLFA